MPEQNESVAIAQLIMGRYQELDGLFEDETKRDEFMIQAAAEVRAAMSYAAVIKDPANPPVDEPPADLYAFHRPRFHPHGRFNVNGEGFLRVNVPHDGDEAVRVAFDLVLSDDGPIERFPPGSYTVMYLTGEGGWLDTAAYMKLVRAPSGWQLVSRRDSAGTRDVRWFPDGFLGALKVKAHVLRHTTVFDVEIPVSGGGPASSWRIELPHEDEVDLTDDRQLILQLGHDKAASKNETPWPDDLVTYQNITVYS